MMASMETDLMGNNLDTVSSPAEELSEEDSSNEFEIEVIDDRPEEDKVSPRVLSEESELDHDDEVKETGSRAEKRIKKLKYEFHEERRAKEAAERMKDEAIRYAEQQRIQNEEMRKVLERGEEVLLGEIRSRTKSDIDRARQAYQAAVEDGDSSKILSAQELLNRAQIENYSAETYSTQRQNSPQGTEAQVDNVPQPGSSQDVKLQKWLAENSWFNSDDEMTAFAMGVHKKLTEKDGISPTTDEYYNKIDARMKSVFPGYFGESSVMGEEEPAAEPAPSVVAPANRSSNNSRKVQLTSTQVALARRLGLTPQQYAKQLLKETGNV